MIPRPFDPYGLPDRECRKSMLEVCLSPPADLVADQVLHTLALCDTEDLGPMRGMTSLFCAVVEQSGLAIRHPVLRRWKALSLREERRHEILREQWKTVTEIGKSLALELTMLRGLRLAEQVYPRPSARHCHAIRLICHPTEREQDFITALRASGWPQQLPSTPLMPNCTTLRGPGRAELSVYRRTKDQEKIPYVRDPLRSATFDAADILSGAVREPQSHSDRWITDIVFLLRRHDPDPQQVAKVLVADGIAGSARKCIRRVRNLAPGTCSSSERLAELEKALGTKTDGWSFWQSKLRTRFVVNESPPSLPQA